MRLEQPIFLVFSLIIASGCHDNEITNVRVVNRAESTVQEVVLEFQDAEWTRRFGGIESGGEAEIKPARPLSRPTTASVRWVEEQVEHTADAEVRKALAKAPGRGTLILNIEPDHKLTVGYEQD